MFTGLLHATGNNLSTAENLIGERVKFYYIDGEWKPCFKPPKPSLRSRFRNVRKNIRNKIDNGNYVGIVELGGFIGFIFLLPLLTPFLLLAIPFSENVEESFGEALASLFIFNVIWIFIILLMYLILSPIISFLI